MEKYLISVIIPAFNAEKTIERAMESIKSPLTEIIVVDDGSEDNTLEICNKCMNKNENLKVFSQTNMGPYVARNLGIKKASGKYVMFLDSDDFYEDNTISRMKELIEKYDEPDLIRFRFKKTIDGFQQNKYFDEREKMVLNRDFKNLVYPMFLNGFMLNSLCTDCIKRQILSNIEMNDNHISFGEDLIHNIKIFLKINNAVFIEDVLYNYNFNQNSIVNSKNKNKKLNNLQDIIEVYTIIYKYLIKWDMYNEENVSTLNERFKFVTTTLINEIKNL